jgi:hypothetical protein
LQKLEPRFGGVLFFEFVRVGVRLITRMGNDDKRSVIYKPSRAERRALTTVNYTGAAGP